MNRLAEKRRVQLLVWGSHRRAVASVAIALMIGGLTTTACGAGQSKHALGRPESVLVPGSEVCGTQLWKGVQTPVVLSFTKPGHYVVRNVLIVGRRRPLVLQLTTDCRVGVRLARVISPDVRVISVAHTRDGAVAGLALEAMRPGRVTLAARQRGGHEILVLIEVAR